MPLRLIFRPKAAVRKRDVREAGALRPETHGIGDITTFFGENRVAPTNDDDLIIAAELEADMDDGYEFEVDANLAWTPTDGLDGDVEPLDSH